MNGEIPSVPITTLAGVASLTDLLPELPLPSPMPHTMNNKSLLYHTKVADDARRLLASNEDSLVSQLASALRTTNTDHIHLKDNMAGDTIEGEIPDLLKAILAKDPNVFKGGSVNNAGNHMGNGNSQPYNQHQEHPSPFQAGQVSPCPPGSPASRFPPQPSGSPYASQTGSQLNAQSSLGVNSKQSIKFQDQFLAFAKNRDLPTVNGGLSSSPGAREGSTSIKNRSSHRSSTVSSPAQTAPPVIMEDNIDRNHKKVSKRAQRGQCDGEPIVVLEPLDPDMHQITRRSSKGDRGDINKPRTGSNSLPEVRQPTIKLTRLESIPQEELDRLAKANRERHRQDDRRGTKRNYEEDDWVPSDEDGSYAPGLSERVKRRRGTKVIIDDESEDDSLYEARRKKKERRHKRYNANVNVTEEELMDSATFKRFNSAIENVLESAEDLDINAMNADEDDDNPTSSEAIVSRSMLTDLCSEAAKLKSMGVMNKVPYGKLVKLLAILQLNIKDGCRIAAFSGDESREEEALWRELTLEKITCAVDASLTALYVMTSPNMPKQVYLEDVIERLVMMAKMQLQNTIFPEFDPVYRIDPKSKHGVQSNIKMKRARASNVRHKSTLTLYNKLSEMIGIMAELIEIQELTDTIILQTSTLSVAPFFVENISEIQLNSLKLVTNIFSRYEKHRQLIMEDILSSLARLPSSKKNIRNYRLNADEQIQMVTALALQLIQCVVKLPQEDDDDEEPTDDPEEREKRERRKKRKLAEQEVVIVTSYETAMRTAHNFLSVFLRKCAIKGEEDYRLLFENFVYDLLSTVNKPEWPAAELLLSLLGRLLVQQFSNKSVDMSMRVASLDYLGIVAARLRKDAITSKLSEETIHEVLREINDESDDETGKNPADSKADDEGEKTSSMQNALLGYLAGNIENDPALVFSRKFYIAQWYRDCSVEGDKLNKQQKQIRNSKNADELAEELEKAEKLLQVIGIKKKFLMSQVLIKVGAFASFKPSSSALDYDNACLVTRYLASNRPFSHSFDIYLTQILKVLCETAVAVRTKAMKCLAAVVEADPAILARTDMQKGVHGRFMDQSTSVREAAVELVGKFILVRPELTTQYYQMLSDRILDTGISVRKRVIKIFRDICMEQPSFPKIPEMCVRMIRRVNDEEGIKKLVNDTFQQMWFTPSRESRRGETDHGNILLHRVTNIVDVVSACKETGYDWFEQLLENLLKKEETASNKPVEKACHQLIDCIVENILKLEESNIDGNAQGSTPRLIACLSTLYLFCKSKPELLVDHVQTIQPYLNIRCQSQGDLQVIHNVARILELAVPLMEHPGESFMAQLEEDMMKLILKHGQLVLVSCVSCLGAVVNNVTHNYKLVRDCFQKFFGVLSKIMAEHKRDPMNPELAKSRPTLLRSLFTVGLLCKQFDFDSEDFGEKKVSIRDRVFDVTMYFLSHDDEEVKHKALTGLGFFCTRHYEFMLEKKLRDVYHEYLVAETTPLKMKCQVLRNLSTYLSEEEIKMIKADHEWKKLQKKEDLKEMGDVQSGMASTVIQLYLKHVLEAFIHSNAQVRMNALGVVCLILKQGLVHPVQCVPYLICMGTDCDTQVRIKADQQLMEIDKKYSGFIQMKALLGIKYTYRLQCLLQENSQEPVRGIRDEDNPVALNSYLYTLIRGSRNHRRALFSTLLNMFDETNKVPMAELIYVADNLAFFPYQTQDEPLYIIHQIDILVSVSGSNILQSFREYFYPGSVEEKKKLDDDEDEDIEVLLNAVMSRIERNSGKQKAQDLQQLQDLYMASQSCVLLLVLKQHLKDLYGFTDSKIHRYSPTEMATVNNKQVNRKQGIKFHPKQVLEIVKRGPLHLEESEEHRRMLVENYLDFKDLMLSIDPDDEDDDDKETGPSGRATPVAAAGGRTPTGDQSANPNVESSGAEGAAPPPDGGQAPAADGEAQHITSRQGGADAGTLKSVDTTPVEQYQHSSSRHRDHHRHHHTPRTELAAQLSGHNDRKRNRSSHSHSRSSSHRSSHSSSTSKHHHNKPHKHKKKKKRRRLSDSEEEEESDDDSDPDFEC